MFSLPVIAKIQIKYKAKSDCLLILLIHYTYVSPCEKTFLRYNLLEIYFCNPFDMKQHQE